jgi:gluconolactonase
MFAQIGGLGNADRSKIDLRAFPSRMPSSISRPPGSGVPDGMRVDRRGNLFVTGPLGIWVWAHSGKHLGTIVLPENAANLAWGDADLRTLYITATSSVYRLKTRTRGFVPYMR